MARSYVVNPVSNTLRKTALTFKCPGGFGFGGAQGASVRRARIRGGATTAVAATFTASPGR